MRPRDNNETKNNNNQAMDHEFITSIETWGSGGQMLDIITLVDGRILLITATAIVLYANRAAFDFGREGTVVQPARS